MLQLVLVSINLQSKFEAPYPFGVVCHDEANT